MGLNSGQSHLAARAYAHFGFRWCHWAPKTPLPFRRIEVGPGAPVIDENGKRRRTYVLRVVLSHSRKAYSESVYRQTADNLIAVLENAFQYFGGVPNPVDNLTMNESTVRSDGLGRALVLKNARDWRGTL